MGDTLVYYIIGDNDASAEGTINRTFNEVINFNGAAALEMPEWVGCPNTQWSTSRSSRAS